MERLPPAAAAARRTAEERAEAVRQSNENAGRRTLEQDTRRIPRQQPQRPQAQAPQAPAAAPRKATQTDARIMPAVETDAQRRAKFEGIVVKGMSQKGSKFARFNRGQRVTDHLSERQSVKGDRIIREKTDKLIAKDDKAKAKFAAKDDKQFNKASKSAAKQVEKTIKKLSKLTVDGTLTAAKTKELVKEIVDSDSKATRRFNARHRTQSVSKNSRREINSVAFLQNSADPVLRAAAESVGENKAYHLGIQQREVDTVARAEAYTQNLPGMVAKEQARVADIAADKAASMAQGAADLAARNETKRVKVAEKGLDQQVARFESAKASELSRPPTRKTLDMQSGASELIKAAFVGAAPQFKKGLSQEMTSSKGMTDGQHLSRILADPIAAETFMTAVETSVKTGLASAEIVGAAADVVGAHPNFDSTQINRIAVRAHSTDRDRAQELVTVSNERAAGDFLDAVKLGGSAVLNKDIDALTKGGLSKVQTVEALLSKNDGRTSGMMRGALGVAIENGKISGEQVKDAVDGLHETGAFGKENEARLDGISDYADVVDSRKQEREAALAQTVELDVSSLRQPQSVGHGHEM